MCACVDQRSHTVLEAIGFLTALGHRDWVGFKDLERVIAKIKNLIRKTLGKAHFSSL